jgi:hypothetical protein
MPEAANLGGERRPGRGPFRCEKRFQHAMRNELVAVVESHTERSVIAFMSDNHVDPDLATEVFILEPARR